MDVGANGLYGNLAAPHAAMGSSNEPVNVITQNLLMVEEIVMVRQQNPENVILAPALEVS